MTEHEDIGRRLRDEAQASAPADLLPAVMADVRAEPRQSRQRRRWPARPRWQPVAAWTAAAATLVALGFGIAHLPSAGSSSSSAESVSRGAALNASAPHVAQGTPTQGQAFTVPKAAAQRILRGFLPANRWVPGALGRPTVEVRVPPASFSVLANQLRQAQLKGTSTAYQGPSSTVIIKLFRTHG
jgi:hypothetical protein